MVNFWQVGSIYACTATVTVDANTNIVSISGTHAAGKDNSMVQGFRILGPTSLNFLPTGVASFFPNLKAIWSESTQISKVSRTDFAPFPQLIQVHFYDHKIESLYSDLFSSNLIVQHISFGANPLLYIGEGTFSSLSALKSLYLERSLCYGGFAINNRTAVLELIPNVNNACRPSTEMIQNSILTSPSARAVVTQIVDAKIAALIQWAQTSGFCGCHP